MIRVLLLAINTERVLMRCVKEYCIWSLVCGCFPYLKGKWRWMDSCHKMTNYKVFPYLKGILINQVKGISIIFFDILCVSSFSISKNITSGLRALSWDQKIGFFLNALNGKRGPWHLDKFL